MVARGAGGQGMGQGMGMGQGQEGQGQGGQEGQGERGKEKHDGGKPRHYYIRGSVASHAPLLFFQHTPCLRYTF